MSSVKYIFVIENNTLVRKVVHEQESLSKEAIIPNSETTEGATGNKNTEPSKQQGNKRNKASRRE